MLILSLLIIFSYGFCCEINWQKNFSLAVDANENTFFPYLPKKAGEIVAIINGNGCQKTAETNRYLMIAFAPQNLEFTDRIDYYDISDQYRESKCQLINSPFSRTLTFEERKKNLKDKWHTIRNCYNIVIQDKNLKSIKLPETQPGCQVTRLSESKISFNGGYCFIKPKGDNDFTFTIELNPDCLSYDGLKEKAITALDFLTTLNFYVAGDATGSSIDLTTIKSLPIRLSTSPYEKLVRNSSSFGPQTPQFNAQFLIPDVYAGMPELTAISDKKVHIRFPVWVDNNCSEKCEDDYCQNICQFAHPIAGLVELSELDERGKEIPISSWYIGGVAQPKYQGEISGQVFRLDRELFEIDKRYRLALQFNDPKYDFEQFKSIINKRLNTVFAGLGHIGRNEIPNIPNIGEIEYFNEVPFIPQITGIDFTKKIHDEFDASLESLSNYLGFRFWPPFYESLCNEEYCIETNDKYLQLQLDFQIKAFNEDNLKYELEILSNERVSKLLPSYKKNKSPMPYVECKI